MAVRRAGLTADQLAELARKLQVGGRPRVRLSGPQFPPDTVGTVVRIGEPAVDGEDFVTVRARIGGVVDELAFSPTELTLASKAAQKVTGRATTTRAPRTKRAAPAPPAPEPAVVAPPVVAPPAIAAPIVAAPVVAPPVTAPPVKAVPPSTAPPQPSAAPPATAAGPRRGAATNRRSTPTPPVTITLTSAGVDWTVSVERGARSLLKKASITPGAVTAVAALLAHPGVIDAVAAVNETARSEAEARAAALRTELAEVQAVLDSHRTP